MQPEFIELQIMEKNEQNEEGIIADSEGEEKVSEDGEPDTGD